MATLSSRLIISAELNELEDWRSIVSLNWHLEVGDQFKISFQFKDFIYSIYKLMIKSKNTNTFEIKNSKINSFILISKEKHAIKSFSIKICLFKKVVLNACSIFISFFYLIFYLIFKKN
ncbi:hypothetical protein BpHYR1_013348 [Brachionus plicatilis]|uniref:Uncharacterized protein n=1 Tax=Brachionus plicatilis TaxID=10195 RepID=A0A3M7Q8I4_BRAPC|nr:hypothetical protein BpHYR1_013348 [Brachionus plicatilis]